MPFSNKQKDVLVANLVNRGWIKHDSLISSPSGGLRFSETYFHDWDPGEMADVFKGRANRIKRAAIAGWEGSHKENCDVYEIISEYLI